LLNYGFFKEKSRVDISVIKNIQNRLTLNIGVRIQANMLILETVEQKTYDNDSNLTPGSNQEMLSLEEIKQLS